MADEKARSGSAPKIQAVTGNYVSTAKPIVQASPPGFERWSQTCDVRNHIAALTDGSRQMAEILEKSQNSPGSARQRLLAVKEYADFALAKNTEWNLPRRVASCSRSERNEFNKVIQTIEALGRTAKESLGKLDAGHSQAVPGRRGTALDPGRDFVRDDAGSVLSSVARSQAKDRIEQVEKTAKEIDFNFGTAKANRRNGFPKVAGPQFQDVVQRSESVLAGLRSWKSIDTIKNCSPQDQKRFQDAVRKLGYLNLEAQKYLPPQRNAGNESETTQAGATRDALLRYNRATAVALSQSPHATSVSMST